MWEAIETYMERKQPLIIIAGADYGQGSSRDWAAKGVRLAGVEAIVAEGFERIHRTNLIGMGVLPLEFKPGVNRKTLGIDGTETYRRGRRAQAARRPDAGDQSQQRRARRSAGDLPPGYGRRSVDLRSRRRAAALRAGLPGVEVRCESAAAKDRIALHGIMAITHLKSKSPPPTCAAAPARACSSACRTCPKRRRCRAPARDALLLRVIGSPDPYGKQIDGMGGATSSTSKTVILSQEQQAGSRRRLSVRPGLHRQAFRRLERQLRQPVRGGRSVRDQQRPGRCRAAFRSNGIGDRAHLAGQHRQDHHRARADHQRRGAGNRRLRTRRRDLPGRRSAARVHRSRPPRKKARAARCSRPAIWSTTSTCPASARSRRR